jgi:hypothetical protein
MLRGITVLIGWFFWGGMLLSYRLLVFLGWYVVILYITGFSGVVCCYFIYYWFLWSGMLLFYILFIGSTNINV